MNKNKKTLQHGFTIVELLIVIVVIGILAAISVVSYNGIQNRAHATVTATNIKAYVNALEMYRIDTGTYVSGSGCVGKVAGEDTSCGFIIYEGTGCAALGATEGRHPLSINGGALNQSLLGYLGAIPEQVQTAPLSQVAVDVPGCKAIIESTAPTYGSATYFTVGSDGSVTGAYQGSGSASGYIIGAYSISYGLKGDVACYLPGSHRTFTGGVTSCALLMGDVRQS